MKNLIKCYCGHTTTCDCIDILELVQIPEEPKQETLEEVAERLYPTDYEVKSKDIINIIKQDTFINGAKWQQERMYSEEETIQLLIKFNQEIQEVEDVRIWFEQFKKK